MTSPEQILATTDWSALDHAYSADASDLPERLVGLLSGDPKLAAHALAVLDAAVLHQGTIYGATTPVALYVAALLPDARTDMPCGTELPWDNRVRPLRAALIEWLGQVAESATYEYEDEDHDDGVTACRAVLPDLYRAIAPYLEDPLESVRAAAIMAAGRLLKTPVLAEHRDAVAERLIELAPTVEPVLRARFAIILSGWGIAPRAFLADRDPAVRAYAAVSPALDDDPVALAEVRAALREPDAADTWFRDVDAPLLEGWFQAHLVEALLRRTSSFEEIVDEAMLVARGTSYGNQASVRAILLSRFPADAPRSPAQRTFQAVLSGGPET